MAPARIPRTEARSSALVFLLTVALVVTILAKAQAVLQPLALALFLAFVLTPVVKALERLRLPRFLAVLLTLLLSLGAMSAFGYVLAHQFTDLSEQLREYSTSMRHKVASLKLSEGGPFDSLEKTVNKVTEDLRDKVTDLKEATPVRMIPRELSPEERFRETVAPVVEPLATVVIVFVLVLFILSKREDLRDRIVSLAGRRRVTVATRTMDETVQRISSFLLAQLIINVGFGTVVATGLYFIGVPYAFLWGFVATVLRFVPYVGSTISMVMPALLAFARFPGWAQMLETVALFIGTDMLTAYGVEPLLIGHRTGVSSLALLVSTVFWTWLWGPMGLLLATPITVCMAVLGRQIPGLQVLSILLGEETTLETEVSFYQRLLARDDDEASVIAEKQRTSLGATGVMDQMLLPTLTLAARDLRRQEISLDDATFVLNSTREVMRQLVDHSGRDTEQASALPPSTTILGIAAKSIADEVLLEMLTGMLDTLGTQSTLLPSTTLAGEAVEQVRTRAPSLVCIAALPPGGATHARYLCRRLRAEVPGVRILILRPTPPDIDLDAAPDPVSVALRECGADAVATTLSEAHLEARALLALPTAPPLPVPFGASAPRVV